jgi:cobalt-zinc-cadmium efflux system membrane fusion protein
MSRQLRLTALRIWLVLFTFLFALILAACSKVEDKKTPSEASNVPARDTNVLTLSPEATSYAHLQFGDVTEEQIAVRLEMPGRVEINDDQTVRIGSLFSGKIIHVLVKVGDRVGDGQPLAKMHTHEVHEAQAEFEKAQAALKQRKTQAEFTKSLLERAERLYQAQAASRNEVERARVEYQAAIEEVARAEAELQRAIGHRELLGLPDDLKYDQLVVVKAVAAGVVMKREVTAGSSVSPGDNLFVISNLSSVWVIAQAPEKSLYSLRIGVPVEISVSAYPNTTFTGKVMRIGDTLNAETRTVEVRCLVQNRELRLKPEMYANVALDVSGSRPALMISQAAVQESDGKTIVFVARGNDQFERRVVTTGIRQGESVEITSGLSAGERVVTAGSFQLKSEFSKDKIADDH